METTQNKTIEFARVNNDSNGNPRYVCHFFALLTQKEIYTDMDINDQYNIALKRAKKIGGKKFHNKQFGGGIIFSCLQPNEITERIERVKPSISEKTTDMIKLTTANGYDYYIGKDEKANFFYCLVPEGSKEPNAGYYSSNYACAIKNVPNLF